MSTRSLATAAAIIPIVFVAVITLASIVITPASRYEPSAQRTTAPLSCEQFVALAMQSTFGNAAEQRHALDRMTPQQFTDASARCGGWDTVASEAAAD